MQEEGLLTILLCMVWILLVLTVYQVIEFSSYKEQQECIFRVINSGLSVEKDKHFCIKK